LIFAVVTPKSLIFAVVMFESATSAVSTWSTVMLWLLDGEKPDVFAAVPLKPTTFAQ
jgi:hypothetical protein